jgi:uncharacterized protein HemX
MKIIKLLVVAALVAAAVIYFMQPKNKAKVEKAADETKTAAESTASAMSKVATNVVGDLKEGVAKAGDVATNVAAKTKRVTTNVISHAADITTNVVDHAKQMFEGATH